MSRIAYVAFGSLIAIIAHLPASNADESPTLSSRIAEWKYPGSKSLGAVMTDGRTLNKKGERTVPSIQCRTVLTTTDSIAKVVDYYKSKLKFFNQAELKLSASKDNEQPTDKPATESSRSVIYNVDSKNRPLAIHIFLVNTDHTSTTLVISRANSESETHIAWTQYVRVSTDDIDGAEVTVGNQRFTLKRTLNPDLTSAKIAGYRGKDLGMNDADESLIGDWAAGLIGESGVLEKCKRWIYFHPMRDYDARLVFFLAQPATSFEARIAIGRPEGEGNAIFVIMADEEEVYRSEPLKGGMAPVKVQVTFPPTKRLTLIGERNGSWAHDICMWLDPTVK